MQYGLKFNSGRFEYNVTTKQVLVPASLKPGNVQASWEKVAKERFKAGESLLGAAERYKRSHRNSKKRPLPANETAVGMKTSKKNRSSNGALKRILHAEPTDSPQKASSDAAKSTTQKQEEITHPSDASPLMPQDDVLVRLANVSYTINE